jgi:hypothetical protein
VPSSRTTSGLGLKRFDFTRLPFQRIDNGSEAMNIDAREAGGTTKIWNGDETLWTRDGSAGQTEETYAAYAGTYGLDTGVRAEDDVTYFDNGSDIDIGGTYNRLAFWLQPKAFPIRSRLRILWKNSLGDTIGSRLLVNDYVPNFDLDVWQKVTIPIADFNLTENVSRLHLRYIRKAGQHFYFDQFRLREAGSYIFRIEAPDASEQYHVERVALVIAAGDTGWNSTAFADIAGGLENGLLLRHHNPTFDPDPLVHWSVNVKTNAHLFGQYRLMNEAGFFDNEQQITMMIEPSISSIVITNLDVLDFIISDDLSSLADMRAFLHVGKEKNG